MNKKRLIFILRLVLFFALLVSGCQHEQTEIIPSIPGIDISSDNVNQDIILILRSSRNTFKIDDDVVIDVHLQSDIQVNSNLDVKMYALDTKNNSWIEVADFVGSLELLPLKNEDFILEKNNPNSAIIVHPVLEEKSTEIKLLITVRGSVLENNRKTSKYVESYIILDLYPP